MPQTLHFFINGNEQSVSASESNKKLIDYLRLDLGLTGTKNGCGTGHCGACTVLIDGLAKRACITKLSQIENRSVLTVEGLAKDGALHPVQRAFLDAGAIQCGFCTPGMILQVVALLSSNPEPSREEIETALDRNICRCTGYVKIIEAVELASIYLKNDKLTEGGNRSDEKKPLLKKTGALESTLIAIDDDGTVEKPVDDRLIGKSFWDTDGAAKATGSIRYADDLKMDGMLFGAFIFSGVPHGKVLSVDTTEAEKMPGVRRIIGAKDVPAYNGFGILKQDQPVFCDNEVNFAFDSICLVLADTEAEAREAAKKVSVKISPLPSALTMDEGLKLYPLHKMLGTAVGDLDAAKSVPDTVTVSGHFETSYQEHACLETESALAVWTESEGLTITATTQSVFEVRRVLSKVLGEPEERIRVKAQALGGGFGSKADLSIEAAVAVAAKACGHPVKVTLNRYESLGFSTKRHPFHMDYTLGVGPDGSFRYYEGQLLSDGGPYLNLSPRVIDQACLFSVGPYRMPVGSVNGRTAKTNNLPCGAFRGFGINQANFAMETLIDEVSEKIHMDPFTIRLKNAFHAGDSTVSGEILRHSVGIIKTLELCKEASERVYDELKAKYPQGSKVLGMGVAACFKNVGAGKGKVDDAGAIYTILPDGKIELRVSGIDMGQGFRTAMIQLAAETLGVPPDEIVEINGDTSLTYHHANAVGERQTLINGSAVRVAGKQFNEKINTILKTDAVRPLCGLTREQRKLLAGVTLGYHYASPKTFPLDDIEGKASVPPEQYRNYPGYAYVTQCAFVEVDTSTGKVRVLKVVSAHDAGRVINPHIVEGQTEGSCSMGIGYALTEHFTVKDGIPETKYLGNLGLPKASETPEYEIIFIENPNPDGPFGAKGISEVATVPMTAAVTNAIYHACGARITKIPATPDIILKALNTK